MKKRWILWLLVAPLIPISAQTEREVNLQEVTVNGAKVVNTPEGQQIFPTRKQKETSASGYHLLTKLALPNIKVDEIAHSIIVTGTLGDVQTRINDIPASREDLLALDMNAVVRVDYISNPGVRYGQNIARVINFITRRAVSGYTVGSHLMQSLTVNRGKYGGYVRFNRGKNEWGVDYDFGHARMDGQRTLQITDYRMSDNRVLTKTDNSTYILDKNRSHELKLRYNRADSDRYVLQAVFSNTYDRSPDNISRYCTAWQGAFSESRSSYDSKSVSPGIDLYFAARFGSHQSLTCNGVGTYISSKYGYSLDEMGKNYSHSTDGSTYSAIGEIIYQHTLKPFTFSSGLKSAQKYVAVRYAGDVQTRVDYRTSDLYLFAQIKGRLGQLGYLLGSGVRRQYYSQGTHQYDYWLVRPKLTLSQAIFRDFIVKYDFGISLFPPRPEHLSDVAIKSNSLAVYKGNPALKPNRRTEHQLILSYKNARLYTHIDTYYRINTHAVMQDIQRDGDTFIYTRTNQKHCNLLYIQNYTNWDIIPEMLSVSASSGIYRCFNYGNTYKHHYTSFNGSVHLTAYLGRLTLAADADNGYRWLEGESKGRQGAAYYVTAAYKWGRADISLYYQHCLQSNPLMQRSELLNRFVHNVHTNRNRDMGNMLSLSVTWRLSKGRKYAAVQRSMNNRDQDSGVMK